MKKAACRAVIALGLTLTAGSACDRSAVAPDTTLEVSVRPGLTRFAAGQSFSVIVFVRNAGAGNATVRVPICPAPFRVLPLIGGSPVGPAVEECGALQPAPAELAPDSTIGRRHVWSGESVVPGRFLLPGRYAVVGYALDEDGVEHRSKPVVVTIERAVYR